MLNRKGLSPLILEIIGGVIIVAIILVMFSGFAAPFLDMLSDQKGVEAFNKFTGAMTQACKDGSDTVPYFTLGYNSPSKIYAISVVSSGTANSIGSAQQCTGLDSGTCVSQSSKDILTKCKENAVCWCLFKITYAKQAGKSESYCANYDAKAYSVSYNDGDVLKSISQWDNSLKNAITSDKISRINVLICSDVQNDMGCNATASDGAAIPVMPRDGPKGGYIMWLQSNMTYFSMGDTKLIISSDLYFDSISFDRPIFGGAYSNYTIFSSKGSLSVKEVDSADIWKTACP